MDSNQLIITSNYSQDKGSFEIRKHLRARAHGRNILSYLVLDQSKFDYYYGSNKNDQNHRCLLACLLGATLLTSVLNTLLLSTVIKSIQLNDRGLINGQIVWDEPSECTQFKLPVNLLDKSIFLKSIESSADRDDEGNSKPLRLEIWPPTEWRRNMVSEDDSMITGEHNLPPLSSKSSGVFLQTPLMTQTNYMALGNDDDETFGLEIGAKCLRLNLLRELSRTAGASGNSRVPSSGPSQQSAKKLGHVPMLNYDDEQQSITLPLEEKLNLNSLTSGSLVVNEQVKSSQVFGALNRNLNVQTRGGNLKFASEGSLKLITRSADFQMTTTQEIVFRSGKSSELFLSSKQLHLGGGIRLFDSYYQPASYNGNADTRDQHNSLLVSPKLDHPSKAPQLRAYNLIIVEGILMAE